MACDTIRNASGTFLRNLFTRPVLPGRPTGILFYAQVIVVLATLMSLPAVHRETSLVETLRAGPPPTDLPRITVADNDDSHRDPPNRSAVPRTMRPSIDADCTPDDVCPNP